MSDDEDYMSDKFLQDSEQCVSSNLPHKSSDERKFALKRKKAEILARLERNKPIKEIEAEKREEGLSSVITNANKGK